MKPAIQKLRAMYKESGRRGSALLVTLMVMVGLSLLGLGFVAISETESAISVNERNATQTLAVAEAGARIVVEWFNSPTWAANNNLLPANTNAIKQERKATVPGNSAGTTTTYQGYYKSNLTEEKLFDLPFKSAGNHRFFGVDEKSADIIIDSTTASTFLDNLNTYLFHDNNEGGRVTEIRVYAPPVMKAYSGSEKTEWPAGSGKYFWNGGTRYGVATIKVTATKTTPPGCKMGVDTPCSIVAQRAVKLVVSEFPFPGPEGPLQSQAGIQTNGAFRVHWGKVVSLGDMALKRDMVSLPWLDAWTPAQWEFGYNTTAANPWPTPAGKSRYLYELINKDFEDPWFQARARGDITTDNGLTASDPSVYPCVNCQPDPYDSVNDVENAGVGSWNSPDFTKAGWSNEFQSQVKDLPPYRKEVIFPRIDYKFWKQIAVSATANSGIFYLKWNAADQDFIDRAGTHKSFAAWVNTLAGAKEGFYFFDTLDGTNPQMADGSTDTTKLTPAISLNSSDGTPDFLAKGFIYLNALKFGSSGIGGPQGYYNAPAEPFRDIGYHEVDTDSSSANYKKLKYNADGSPHIVNYTNYQWDYQDVNGNGKFDIVVEQRASQATDGSDTGTLADMWFVKPYTDACGLANLIGNTGGAGCSEPHEPYLNLIPPYPDACCGAGGEPNTFKVLWQSNDLSLQTRRAKTFQSNGTTPVSCDGTSSTDNCTSNGYDKVGGLMHLDNTSGPILDGVFYNEGAYASTGNAIYYGAVMIRGLIETAGNVDVWFDNRLVTGNWQERFKNLPRVVITSHETD